MRIDFQELVSSLPTAAVLTFLDAPYKEDGGYVKTECPDCGAPLSFCTKGEKKNIGYCTGEKRGMNILQYATKRSGNQMREIAELLVTQVLKIRTEPNKPISVNLELDYARSGYHPELSEELEIGYCKKGVLAGHVAYAVHNEKGEKIVYIGQREKMWKWGSKTFSCETVLYNIHRVSGNTVYVMDKIEKAVWLHGYGIPAVATFGNTILTQPQLQQIERFKFVNFLQGEHQFFDSVTINMARRLRSYWRILSVPQTEQEIATII